MALNAELYYHLGKNDLNRVLESGSGNYIELNGIKVVILGDHLEDENALIISNHVSLIDYIIFPYLTRRALDDTVNKVVKHDGSEIKKFESGVEIEIEKEKRKENEEKKEKEKKKERKKEKIREKTNNNDNKNKNNNKIIEQEQVIFAKDLSSMLIPKLNFFTWFNIWNIPNVEYFKNISQANENWELDGETLNVVFKRLINSCDYTQWLAMFPEVNIFTEKDSKLQQIMGEKYYLPTFENVLYPRFGGLANAIGGLYKTKFTRLYDITLLYYNKDKFTKKILSFNPPTLLNAFGLKDKNIETVIVIHIAGKFLSRVPLKRNKLEKWLENRWIKKDKLINKLKSEILKVEIGKD